jgi:signal transduction histidine kinase
MRERAVLYGGRLETTTSPGGGFTVHAVLPVEAAAA